MPKFVQIRFAHRANLLKVFNNSGWLLIEKFIRIVVGVFVGVWIARYLGPEKFGLWNYAISFATIFGVLASLGLDSIVMRELVKDPHNQDIIMGSAFGLKLIASLVTFLLTVGVVLILWPYDHLVVLLVALSAAGFIFQSINVVDFYFQAQVNSKYTVFASSTALLIISLIKIFMILNNSSLIAFAWAGLVEVLLTSSFLLISYKVNHQQMRNWKFNKDVVKKLLLESWPLLLASVAVTFYMKIDMVMLQEISGSKQVGIYSAATRLSEVWYLIPMVIVSSVSPTLISCHQKNIEIYLNRIRKMYFWMGWLAVSISLIVTFISGEIVNLFYGSDYSESSAVLAIHMWASIAVFHGVASSQHLIINNLQKISFFRTLIGFLINVILNLFLIPKMGAKGAALATLISYFAATYSLILFKSTFEHGKVLIFSPFKPSLS